jgi:ferrochelatase
MDNGGKKFGYIPCLNDQKDHIDMIETLIKSEINGW